jgi:hypothetical protein
MNEIENRILWLPVWGPEILGLPIFGGKRFDCFRVEKLSNFIVDKNIKEAPFIPRAIVAKPPTQRKMIGPAEANDLKQAHSDAFLFDDFETEDGSISLNSLLGLLFKMGNIVLASFDPGMGKDEIIGGIDFVFLEKSEKGSERFLNFLRWRWRSGVKNRAYGEEKETAESCQDTEKESLHTLIFPERENRINSESRVGTGNSIVRHRRRGHIRGSLHCDRGKFGD